MPHEPGVPEQLGAGSFSPPLAEANTDSFFTSLVEPQCGHFVPFQALDRTRISLSRSQFPQ